MIFLKVASNVLRCGVRFADFISFILISHENEIIWSPGEQILHFNRIFKKGVGKGAQTILWIRQSVI